MTDLLLEDNLKVRFCPSPTGMIHIGNVRTALFNALIAMHNQGTLLLRIEDTDEERSDERYTQAVMQDLRWLGLQWQEGVDVGGDFGPYHQSKRQPVYDDYYRRLEASHAAYPCFCSEEELNRMRRIQRTMGKPPRYAGTCRHLSEDEVQAKLDAGEKPTLRFRVPENEAVEFIDLVKGPQRILTDDISDFVIRRADGTAPFMFSNAIDDALMEVTMVVRGEDHVTNTPRQIMILDALGLNIPAYAHVALILGNDDSPLSKRNGSQSVEQLRKEGYLASAIYNYLARLGHFFGHDQFYTLAQLAAEFKIENLNKSPAKFNVDQLNFWQKEAVMHLTQEQFWQWLGDDVAKQVPAATREEFFAAVQGNVRFPRDAQHWIDVLFCHELKIHDNVNAILRNAKPNYFNESLRAVELHGGDLRKIIEHLKQTVHVEGRDLYQPLRVALTGELHGPELDKILHLMDTTEIKRRLEHAR